jgi:hypothetical protein
MKTNCQHGQQSAVQQQKKHISKAEDNYSFPHKPSSGTAEVLGTFKWKAN